MRLDEMPLPMVLQFYRDLYTKTLDKKPRKPQSRVVIRVEDVSKMLDKIQAASERRNDAGTVEADRDNWRSQALAEASRYDILIDAVKRMLTAEEDERKAHEAQMAAYSERKAAENAVVDIAMAALSERQKGVTK